MKAFWAVLGVFFLSLIPQVAANTAPNPIPESKPQSKREHAEQWKLMVGRWYGSQPTTDGGRKEWIVERKIDGTYRIDFRTTRDKHVRTSTEVGEWGVSGPIYFTIFKGWIIGDKYKPADTTSPYNRDAYRIVELNNTEFTYESVSHDEKYTVRRVDAAFQL